MKCRSLLQMLIVVILPGAASAQPWTQTSATNVNWRLVLSSSDGTKLTALQGGEPLGTEGSVFMSTDSGGTWSLLESSPNLDWTAIAGSTNGGLFVGGNGDKLYTMSTFPAPSWHQRANLVGGSPPINSVAASANATVTLAGTGYTETEPVQLTFGDVLFSTDSGVTWTTNNLPQAVWISVACSGNGNVYAAAQKGGSIYVSTNSGSAWQTNNWPVANWQAIVLSANGGMMAAVVSNGLIFATADLGNTWQTNDAPSAVWRSIAMSADGTKMIAAGGTSIYTSTNSGVNWISNTAPSLVWNSVASSGDGSKLVAASGFGGSGAIYTWQTVPALSLGPSANGLLLSWPTLASTTNYVLQQNGDLTTTNWVTATNQSGITNGQYQAVVSPQNGNQFYRLLQLR
jgi:hypothetical protein